MQACKRDCIAGAALRPAVAHLQQPSGLGAIACTRHAAYDMLLSQAKHRLDALMGTLLEGLLRQQPRDPLQYMIDTLTLGSEAAQQVGERGAR